MIKLFKFIIFCCFAWFDGWVGSEGIDSCYTCNKLCSLGRKRVRSHILSSTLSRHVVEMVVLCVWNEWYLNYVCKACLLVGHQHILPALRAGRYSHAFETVKNERKLVGKGSCHQDDACFEIWNPTTPRIGQVGLPGQTKKQILSPSEASILATKLRSHFSRKISLSFECFFLSLPWCFCYCFRGNNWIFKCHKHNLWLWHIRKPVNLGLWLGSENMRIFIIHARFRGRPRSGFSGGFGNLAPMPLCIYALVYAVLILMSPVISDRVAFLCVH